MTERGEGRPRALLAAVAIVLTQAATLAAYAVLEVFSITAERATMGATTSLFFAFTAAVLVGCAWAVWRGRSWGRSPLVLAQLIALGLAWSFRGGSTTWVAALLAVAAVVVLAGVMHPASLAWLDGEGHPADR